MFDKEGNKILWLQGTLKSHVYTPTTCFCETSFPLFLYQMLIDSFDCTFFIRKHLSGISQEICLSLFITSIVDISFFKKLSYLHIHVFFVRSLILRTTNFNVIREYPKFDIFLNPSQIHSKLYGKIRLRIDVHNL